MAGMVGRTLLLDEDVGPMGWATADEYRAKRGHSGISG